MRYTIDEIAQAMQARVEGDTEAAGRLAVNWLLTDSRSLCFPGETLFFALRTRRNDGARYVADLYRRGVRVFCVREDCDMSGADIPHAVILRVGDTLRALQDLATHHRQKFRIPLIAVTGSNGKTTVKEWLYQLLSPDHRVSRSPRSYNSQVGVPLSLWLIDRHTDVAIIEAGISRPGEMERLERIVRPTVGVLTNIGQAHQENFLSLDIKCTEKMQLLSRCQTAVLNESDNCVAHCAEALPQEVRRMVWNTQANTRPSDENTVVVRSVEREGTCATVHFAYHGQASQYTIPFTHQAAVENSLTCLVTCLALGLPLDETCRRLGRLEPVAMRMEVKDGVRGCTLINDTYNSDIHSLDIALDFMNRRPDTKQQRRTLILSDILQSGESPRALYGQVAEMARRRNIARVIGVGEEIGQCADFFPQGSVFFHSTDELLKSDLFADLHDEFLLIKGARQYRFDRISDQLTLKVHQTTLQVNLNAIVDNLNHYRKFLRPETKMVCMVKASAYGTGSVEVSKTLQDHGVDYLAVAVADEGADLRRAGITANIMVMNPEMNSFRMLFDYHLEPEVFSFDILEALIHAAEKEGITNYPVHIKLDTGMHRLGFNPEQDMGRLVDRLTRQSAIIPCSVFSHFVGSDCDQMDDFSRQQFERYDKAATQLQAAYSHHILRHICNSAAIEHFPQWQMDMVRLGLGLYGIDPRDNHILHNVASLKTTILQIRDVPAGDSIGYSRKTYVNRPSRVAAIPIGYADGLNRCLGNRHCYCLVRGHQAPYLGNICMDVCMIDVTDIPDAQVGDRVTIFGDDLPVTVLSDAAGTIPYEILTGISQRVQHIYSYE